MSARNNICLALDTADLGQARRWAEESAPFVGWVKVGLQLYTAYGPDSVRYFEHLDQKVFLDLKLHDIPNTVQAAVWEIAGLGASLVNVHAQGGSQMISEAVEAASNWSKRFGRPRPLVVAVTLLTSISDDRLANEIKVELPLQEYVLHLARLSREAGADGVVASPLEAGLIRQELGPDFQIITPGIRPVGGERGDQQRVDTPAAAIKAGASMLVIGRPITQAPNPAAAAQSIMGEVERAIG